MLKPGQLPSADRPVNLKLRTLQPDCYLSPHESLTFDCYRRLNPEPPPELFAARRSTPRAPRSVTVEADAATLTTSTASLALLAAGFNGTLGLPAFGLGSAVRAALPILP